MQITAPKIVFKKSVCALKSSRSLTKTAVVSYQLDLPRNPPAENTDMLGLRFIVLFYHNFVKVLTGVIFFFLGQIYDVFQRVN